MNLRPLGDRAYLAGFEDERQARAWSSAVLHQAIPGVVDVVTAYANVAVIADPERVSLDALESRLSRIQADPTVESTGRLHEIPVLYDGEDLAEIARHARVTGDDVIALHSGVNYTVQAVGFLPGFPYAGQLPEPLRGLPRRPTPRVRVPAGSVAIAGEQTGIYPDGSPGGWNLLGRTPLQIADIDSGFFPIEPGDRIRFRPIRVADFSAILGTRLVPGTQW